jgi:hypothetical protein
MGDFKVGVSVGVYCTKCTLNTGVNTNFEITQCIYNYFITIGAGAVVTPKMLPIYLQFIVETYPLKILGLKTPTVHYKK